MTMSKYVSQDEKKTKEGRKDVNKDVWEEGSELIIPRKAHKLTASIRRCM